MPPGVTWPLSGPCARLISAAIVINACSTFVAFFALVSKKGICSWSANSWDVKGGTEGREGREGREEREGRGRREGRKGEEGRREGEERGERERKERREWRSQ